MAAPASVNADDVCRAILGVRGVIRREREEPLLLDNVKEPRHSTWRDPRALVTPSMVQRDFLLDYAVSGDGGLEWLPVAESRVIVDGDAEVSGNA